MIYQKAKEKIILENFSRMKYLSLIFIGFSTFSLFIDYYSLSIWNEEHINLYKLLDIIFALMSVFSLIFFWHFKRTKLLIKDISVKLISLFVLTWAAIITGIEFTSLGFSTFVLVLISAVFFISLKLPIYILFFVISLLALIITIYLGGHFNKDIYPFLVMLIPITTISVLLSGKNYQNKLKTIEQRDKLEILNQELLIAKQNLEKKVEARTNELLNANNELKQINKELSIAKQKAEESDQLKTKFLANMSHEIRTPMNAIIGFSDLLIDRNHSEDKRNKFLKFINTGSKRLLNIISDIIDISKIDSNQISVKRKPCEINKLIDDLFAQFSVYLRNPDVTIETLKSLSDKESSVLTDGNRLTQILSNLIVNASKFTEEGVIEFGYTMDDSMLKFHVKDTGIGIEPKYHNLIFERFGQVKNDSESMHEGTGLGLSIVKGLVNLMNGKIWVESEINQGAIFYFTIPYIPAE